MRKWSLVILLALLCPTAGARSNMCLLLQRDSKEDVNSAIANLWSTDSVQRESAKARLVDFGQESVAPLIALLTDLLNNPEPRSAVGNEASLEAARERYNQSREEDAAKEVSDLSINGRLKQDAFDLLIELRAVEAVPTLISLMWCEIEIPGREDLLFPPMAALEKMGQLAVPKLVEELESANLLPESLPYFNSRLQGEERKAVIDHLTKLKQRRIIRVLRGIGDPRALPALENLLKATNDVGLTSAINKAMENIRRQGL